MEKVTKRAATRLHRRDADRQKTVLVQDLNSPDNRLQLRTSGLWLRLRARAMAGSLDRELAQGVSPESKTLLAVRACRLATPTSRRRIALNWKTLVERAHNPHRGARLSPVPVMFGRVVDAETSIEEMLQVLSSELPSPARGIAMANWVLRDGLGPIYNQHSCADLDSVVREATSLLDPRTSLNEVA